MEIKENCGIFGIYGNKEAARLTFLGLYALQHRGEESCGIAVSDGHKITLKTGKGLVSENFSPEELDLLKGNLAIGHVRYSTTGGSTLQNVQPFVINHLNHSIGIAHNGNLTNTRTLRTRMEKRGSIFQTTMDSEIILHLVTSSGKQNIIEAIKYALRRIEGAYSLLFITPDKIIAARDPLGIRPLVLGNLWGSYIVCSETSALDIIDAKYIREIEPGEILVIDRKGIQSTFITQRRSTKRAHCIFELIYFAKPDSNVFGINVYEARKRLGERLAEEAPVDADIVIPIPDSGTAASIGYSHKSGIPFEMAMSRNHYIGRTFIQPSQITRIAGVKIKLNPIKSVIKGKRIVVVEDSIVRGTTSRERIKELREAGAKEVHMRVACPPHRFPCYFGIDFPDRNELIANRMTIEAIKEFLCLDSLYYLSYEGMIESIKNVKNFFCTACFNGKYPIKIKEKVEKMLFDIV